MNPLQAIGTYETKTHLADLLRQVRAGQGFTITQRGEPVADLLPTGRSQRRAGVEAALQMQQFMRANAQLPSADIAALIAAGRD